MWFSLLFRENLLRCWRCSSRLNISQSQILAVRSQSQSVDNDNVDQDANIDEIADPTIFILVNTIVSHWSKQCITDDRQFPFHPKPSLIHLDEMFKPGRGLPSSKGRQGHQLPNHLCFQIRQNKLKRWCWVEFTAGNLHRAHLPVKRVELQIHRAGQRQRHSDAEKIKLFKYIYKPWYWC